MRKFTLLLLLILITGTGDAWWNTSFDYKIPIEINSSSELTNYQMGINVTHNPHMNNDFSDLRFTNYEENLSLSYWIKEKVDVSWAYVWVKIDSVDTNNGTQGYVYYGNPSASSASNYTATMESSPIEWWNRTHDGGSGDEAHSVAVDSQDNVIVTGHVHVAGNNNDYYTIKYNSDGTELWNRTWDSNIDLSIDKAYAVAVDSQDNVIVTGLFHNSVNYDYYTIKYNSDGTELWNRTYNGGSLDEAYAVSADSQNNVIVTGKAHNGADYDYHTIKYNSDGTELWNRTYDSGSQDYADGVAVDSQDNVIVTGYVNQDYYTIKYNSNGTELWNKTYNGGNLDRAYAVAVDSQDRIIVTGWVDNGVDYDYYTIQYESNGTEIWTKTWDNVNDYSNGVAVNSQDNVILTGYSNNGTSIDYYTIKYKSNGTELWNTTYCIGNDNKAYAVAVDSQDDMIVTGYSYIGANNDYYTIKYSERKYAYPLPTCWLGSEESQFPTTTTTTTTTTLYAGDAINIRNPEEMECEEGYVLIGDMCCPIGTVLMGDLCCPPWARPSNGLCCPPGTIGIPSEGRCCPEHRAIDGIKCCEINEIVRNEQCCPATGLGAQELSGVLDALVKGEISPDGAIYLLLEGGEECRICPMYEIHTHGYCISSIIILICVLILGGAVVVSLR